MSEDKDSLVVFQRSVQLLATQDLKRGEIRVSANGEARPGICDPLKRCYQIV